MALLKKIHAYLNTGSQRSVLAKKNIVGAFVNKSFAILISFCLIPVTIDYLNSEQYGIWLTLSSIVMWISYFDIGLVNGFKNHFAEAKAKGNLVEARQYVSTTYAIMALIFNIVLIIGECLIPYIDWSIILNIDDSYRDVLTEVCGILLLFVSIQLILGVMPALLTADQRPAYASMITTIGQAAALIAIFILTLLPNKSMTYICIALSGIPCMTLFVFTILLFKNHYKQYKPSISYVRFTLVGNIIGLGSRFFIIQVSMLLIFQVTNIILSRILGPESVTVYNVTYKYFSILQMVFNILLSPFWSAFTDAYTKRDFNWMRNVYKKLTRIYRYSTVVAIGMFILSPLVYKIWLPDDINVSWTLSLAMCIYLLILTYSNILMILINGTGKVFMQMIVYVCCALIAIPLSITACKYCGIIGITLVLGSVYGLQAIISKVQIEKILMRTASGIWEK